MNKKNNKFLIPLVALLSSIAAVPAFSSQKTEYQTLHIDYSGLNGANHAPKISFGCWNAGKKSMPCSAQAANLPFVGGKVRIDKGARFISVFFSGTEKSGYANASNMQHIPVTGNKTDIKACYNGKKLIFGADPRRCR